MFNGITQHWHIFAMKMPYLCGVIVGEVNNIAFLHDMMYRLGFSTVIASRRIVEFITFCEIQGSEW
jgi:hypothetical protein